jgi:flagellar basal-body rod protein FlgC
MNVNTDGIFHAIRVSASGLKAEMQKLRVASANIANVHTTRTPEGGPYMPRKVELSEAPVFGHTLRQAWNNPDYLNGVEVSAVQPVTGVEPRLVYDPHHPDAGPDGMVAYPPIDIPLEMVDVLSASRAYEANVSALEAGKHMMDKALEI